MFGGERNMRVDELHRIRPLERPSTGEHLVEYDAERVEVGPSVDAPIHAPGLLGRSIGEGTREDSRIVYLFVVVRHHGSDAEIGDLYSPLRVHQDALRLDVSMDDVMPVDIY